MKHLFIYIAILLGISALAGAQVSAKRDAANPQQIIVQNEYVRLVINLARGAHIDSYRYRGFDDAELVFDTAVENGGLFKDLWSTQGWPGEFDAKLYEAEIVKAGPDEAVVKTWTTSTGKWSNRLNEDLADFLLVKIFTLKKGERTLSVRVDLTNNGKKGKRPAFWAQHALDLDGTRKHNVYWRSTRHAIDWISEEKRSSEYGYWYVAQVNAGWNGVTNPTLKRGVIFLMDYNDLQHVYDNTAACTVEWMYDDVAIPAGKTWTTVIDMIPTEGFAGYTRGGRDLIGYVEGRETPGGLAVTHTLAAATRELKDVKVQTRVKGVRAQWEVAAEPFTAEHLGYAPLSKTVTITGIGAMPCVVQVTVTGKDADGKPVEVSYEDYVGGKAGRNLDLTTLEPMYQFPVPEKRKQYLKPDAIALQHANPPKILFIRGLWAEFQGIDAAVKTLGQVTVVDGWMKKGALGETLGNFPASYDDLLGYDAIILGNVSGPMLSMVGQEMLADFLKAGGGVLMLSGDRTYGQTTFSNANFANLLPFTTAGYGDYGRLPAPSALKPAAGPLTAGCAFPAGDVALYAHRLAVKPGASVPVTLADGSPALILSADNAPRVAAVAVLPFGKAPAGQRLYFQGEAWQQLMANTLKWLLRK